MNNKPRFVPMKYDVAFKHVMQNKKVLSGFLAALLKIRPEEITGIVYLDTVIKKDHENGRSGIMDIYVTINNQINVNVEMQQYTTEYWRERSLYYNFRNYTDQSESGSEFNEFASCVHVGILNFNLLKDSNQYHHCFMLKSITSNMLYTDKIVFHVIELKKVKNTKDEDKDDLFKWIQLINSETREEIAMLARNNEEMEEALKLLDELNQDPVIRRTYWQRKVQQMEERQRIFDEQRRREEEQRWREEEQRRREEEQRWHEEERRILNEQQKLQEKEQRIAEEQQRMRDEKQRIAEEQQRIREEQEKIKAAWDKLSTNL